MMKLSERVFLRTAANQIMKICVCSELLLYFLNDNGRSEEESFKFFNLLFYKSGETDVSKFEGYLMNDLPKVKEMFSLKNFFTILTLRMEISSEIVLVELTRWLEEVRWTLFIRWGQLLRQQCLFCFQSFPL